MTLAELYASLGAHPGSWTLGGIPTPDFGATERLGGDNAIPQNIQRVIAPIVQQKTGLNIGAGASTPSTLGLATQAPYDYSTARSTGGTLTQTTPLPGGGGSGGSGGGGGGGLTTNSADAGLADTAYQLAINRVRNLFNAGREQANMERTNANNRFADIMSAVDAFKKQAQTLKDNSGQEITNTASDILHGNAVNARNLVGKATGQARSLGLGLSSRLNLGQGLMQNLESTQGNVLAKKGEQNRANDVLYGQRIDTGNAQLDTARTNRDAALAAADAYDRVNVDNYGTNEQQAGLDFASMLNNIVNYNRQLAAINPVQANSLTPYTADMGGIVNTINSTLNGLPSTGVTTGNTAANLSTPTSLVDLLKRQGIYGGSTSL